MRVFGVNMPSPAGVALRIRRLVGAGAMTSAMAERTVDKLYASILGREADAGGRAGFVEALKAGTMDAGDIARIMVESEEFSEAAYRLLSVKRRMAHEVIEALMRRDPGVAGQVYGDALASGMTTERFLTELIQSPEFRTAHGIGVVPEALADDGAIMELARLVEDLLLRRLSDEGYNVALTPDSNRPYPGMDLNHLPAMIESLAMRH